MKINKFCGKCGRNIHKDRNPEVTYNDEKMCKGCMQERQANEEQ